MKDSWIGQVGIRGQRHYRYLKENKPTVLSVMRMNWNLNSYLREVDEQAKETPEKCDEAMNEMHSLAEVEAFSYGFRMGVQLTIEAGVPFVK